jgi:transcriptional regulator with XRE-family HTH domain
MDIDSDEAVGRRIIALRLRAKLQQQELAKELHVAKSTLNGYERGERPVPMESAKRLRRRFGVTLDWLLFGDMQIPARDLMFELGPEPQVTDGKKVRKVRN